MKINTNSNAYTIIYASVLVIVVAFILAFASSALKETQNKNVEFDKMKQILSALRVDSRGQDVQEIYNSYIKKDQIIDASGNVVQEEGGFYNIQTNDRLTVYVAEVDGETKYILPLNGNGLWGPIWGYVALNSDKSTIYGTFFSHAGETPGLGAEIATAPFQAQFEGKEIQKGGQVVSIAVVKPGRSVEGQDYVDGISGGTITSVAVQDMLMTNLRQYNNFLTKE